MSSDSRRPIRLHPASELGETPPRPPAAAPALAQSADRFRRTLMGPARRSDAPRRPAGAPAPATARAPAGREGVRPASPVAVERTGFEVEEAGAAHGAAAAGASAEADGEFAPRDGDAPGSQVTGASEGWADHMAQQIVLLCRRADPAFVTWTVTVPLDPDVLPDTELRIHLSEHWLSLRFASHSPRSTDLIFRHRSRLQLLLERTPNLPHGIDIEVT